MKNLKTPGKTGTVGRYDRQYTQVWCYLQLVTLKCLFSTVRITVSSHNFKLQNYSGKYLLNLNNNSFIGICLSSRIRLS